MSELLVTIAALVLSASAGACVGFVAARLFPTQVKRHEPGADRPAPAPAPAPAIVCLPSTVSEFPPTSAFVASQIFESELTDDEIDALPADLPFLAHARPRIASPPRTRVLNRL